MQTANLLDLAADRLVIYPTEVLCLFARLTGAPQTAASQVQVWLPENLVLEEDPAGSPRQSAGQDGQGLCITWNLPAMLPAAMEWSLAVRARQEAVGALTCTAFLIDAQGNPLFERSLSIEVKRMARSLDYLPEIYRQDDFTNRFLMLFESFWQPLSRQIDTIDSIFDPHLTPARFLPWLGSWFGLAFAADLPEARRRDLLANIVPIFATTGTKQALVTFLQLYTGGQVEVREHTDDNLVLGPSAHLGYQVALGTGNRPHAFDVKITLRNSYFAPAGPASSPEEEQRAYAQCRRQLESIIHQIKPADTYFSLELVFRQPESSQ